MAIQPEQNNNVLCLARFLKSGHFRIRRLSEAQLLAPFLAEACPNPRMAVVGIHEMLVNAIEHGNLGISFEEKSTLQQQNDWLTEIDKRLDQPEHIQQYVDVELSRTDSELQIKITDQGKGFDWKKFSNSSPKDPLSTHGRGIFMAKNLAFKELKYSEKGNEVTCIISLI